MYLYWPDTVLSVSRYLPIMQVFYKPLIVDVVCSKPRINFSRYLLESTNDFTIPNLLPTLIANLYNHYGVNAVHSGSWQKIARENGNNRYFKIAYLLIVPIYLLTSKLVYLFVVPTYLYFFTFRLKRSEENYIKIPSTMLKIKLARISAITL